MNPLYCFCVMCLVLAAATNAALSTPPNANASHARIPNHTPLDAVKWTGGFWQDRMRRLGDIYLPETMDTMFQDPANGASFRNFPRSLRLEAGGVIGRIWGDGDCYCVLDAAARMVAYRQDEYCKTKLSYWIPLIAKCQNEMGLIDTWGKLAQTGEGGMEEGGTKHTHGCLHYNHGFLHAAALSHYRATGSQWFFDLAHKTIGAYLTNRLNHGYMGDNIPQAYCSEYAHSGDKRFIDAAVAHYQRKSPFGPPLRHAQEIFGHGTLSLQYVTGATHLYGYTGDQELLAALRRLAKNTVQTKQYITGAVGSVAIGTRPQQSVNGITYPEAKLTEAIGVGYDLPNDNCYNETCTICLFMEWMYFMFQATGDALYMDEVERSLYNSVPGCVDLEHGKFFYANPQEQTTSSKRVRSMYENVTGHWIQKQFTWRRTSPMRVACCPPKVLRALARSAEMAYSVNAEGCWVNLYGNNTLNVQLPWGGSLELQQKTEYPWDGKVELVVNNVQSKKPFSVFLRVPGWVSASVGIRVNGKVMDEAARSGTYFQLHRTWAKGDKVEWELPMAVRFMTANPRIVENRGKVAVMRGPVVYCLEGDDVSEGAAIENVCVPAAAVLTPVYTKELGGVMKLTGTLICSTSATATGDKLIRDEAETALYREARFAKEAQILPHGDRRAGVSMIPYYARLNRKSDYFRIWLPVY